MATALYLAAALSIIFGILTLEPLLDLFSGDLRSEHSAAALIPIAYWGIACICFGLGAIVDRLDKGQRTERERTPRRPAGYENWQCPQCERVNAPTARFCNGCGTAKE